MLDENDSKIIVEQLEEKLKTLHKCETMYTRQMQCQVVNLMNAI